MRRLLPIMTFLLAAAALTGCDPEKTAVSAKTGRAPAPREEEAAPARRATGKDLLAYAPATDFTGASPEDAAGKASAMFDGALTRDAVSANGYGPVSALGGRAGKRLPYTAASSERRTDLHGAVPPLPDDYDYSRSGATPGSAREAGQTLLGFASFQIAQKFPTVAPIMSRLGWRAAARRGSNTPQSPYRVTVHHTQGNRPMTEAETAAEVKNIQHYHMAGRGREGKDNFDDIGYHFLIAGDGRVIEGRRAEYLGAHAGGANEGNIGVAMMGDFNKVQPADAQIESLTRLVTYLSVKYKKDPNAKGFLEAHQHYTSTDCPGRNLMAMLGSLRRKIDQENEIIVGGGSVGAVAAFTPLAVIGAPGA
ncbi:MAG: peptidoglycan recognition family protein [Elusimicrobia bacterium]|nr:peptidoglycan recognition family protein [Elusimicrobiota bacterium]